MDIQKYLSGMLDYNPKVDWMEEQTFDENGMPITMNFNEQVQTEAIPKSMPIPMSDADVHEAADIAQQLKAAWLKGAKDFMGGSGMLNSKPELRPEEKQNQNIKAAPSEKPGWMMAEGTNFWSVNTDDAYWDSEKGYQEALALYGTSPAWSSRPVEKENNFVDLQPTKRISL